MNKSFRGNTSDSGTRGAAIRETAPHMGAGTWMQSPIDPQSNGAITADQRTSISALITCQAKHSGENEFRIERRLADRFNIANVMCLTTDQYDEAIRYLVDNGTA